MTGVFAQNAPTYAAAGIPCFPVDPMSKKPLVQGWNRLGTEAVPAWIDRFGDADGIGIRVGPSSGIVEVDVDLEGDAPLAAAIERFGETPLSIRTASGKSKLWYSHNGEGRRLRVLDDLLVDVLGDGCTIAPPSRRTDLGTSYRFLTGDLESLDALPVIRADALDPSEQRRIAESIVPGTRNNSLFRQCMEHARHCDDVETLIDVAQTLNVVIPEPLGRSEVERIARSAWGYETKGRNFVGLSCPQVTSRDRIMDDLGDAPDAFFLRDLLVRYHGHGRPFSISPSAMSREQNPPWGREKIARARNVLVEREYLDQLSKPSRGRKKAGLYRLTRKMSDSSNNHYTPFPQGNG